MHFESETAAVVEDPIYQVRFVSDGLTRLVHAATAVQRSDGAIQAFWFGGTREGHADVRIFTATFDPDMQRWTDETPLLTRQETARAERRHVRKLGNPVATVDPQGRILLFYVSVSFGGWSGSSINLVVSEDNGQTWSKPRQLITSPFLNVSTLVKGPVVQHADGTMGLPVYHEFLGKFSEYLRLDGQGRVLGKSRVSYGRFAIQPVVFPLGKHGAMALMRNTDSDRPRLAWSSRTKDGGQTWSAPERSKIMNRNSALGGALSDTLSDVNILLAAANVTEYNRSSLALLRSTDQGRDWAVVHDVEPHQPSLSPEEYSLAAAWKTSVSEEDMPLSPEIVAAAATETQCEPGRPICDFRFDYPWLLKDVKGRYHLFYTWNRAFIRHVTFNSAWLKSRPDQSLEDRAYQELAL
ncbi:sialidase family protein [Desulfonatronum thiodismutans]|uniref:sialidase family protein n=1 Tax=Desulfonatronum thiodismutans TaxID=159290 RepID=UPI001377EB8C|nr:sialidase family protein [Desulfonatronum thiodismutans]